MSKICDRSPPARAARLLAVVAGVVLLFGVAPLAYATGGTLTVDYLGHFFDTGDPYNPDPLYVHGEHEFAWGSISLKGDADRNGTYEWSYTHDEVLVGQYPFEVSAVDDETAQWFSVNQRFNAYCIDLAQNLDPYGQPDVSYTVTALEALTPGGMNDPLSAVSAKYLREFYARNWKETPTDAEAEAFGAGLWEILYEDPANGYSFADGRLQAWDFEDGGLAAGYLSVLDGSDTTGEVYALVNPLYQDVAFLVPGSGGVVIIPGPKLPEPLTMVSLLAGIAGLGGYVIRKRKRA